MAVSSALRRSPSSRRNPLTASAVSSPARSWKWYSAALCDRPARRAIARRLTCPGPAAAAATSSAAASRRRSRALRELLPVTTTQAYHLHWTPSASLLERSSTLTGRAHRPRLADRSTHRERKNREEDSIDHRCVQRYRRGARQSTGARVRPAARRAQPGSA